MSFLKKVRSYFSCPWTVFVMLGVTVLHAIASTILMVDLPGIMHHYLGFSQKQVMIVMYIGGLAVSVLAFTTSIISDNWTGRFPVMCVQAIAVVIGFSLITVTTIPQLQGTWYAILIFVIGLIFNYFNGAIQRSTQVVFMADQFEGGDYPPESRQRMFSWGYLIFNISAIIIFLIVVELVRGIEYHMYLGVACCIAGSILFFACCYWFKKLKCKKSAITDAIKCMHYGLHGLKNTNTEKQSDSDKSAKETDKASKKEEESVKKSGKKVEEDKSEVNNDSKVEKVKDGRSEAGKDEKAKKKVKVEELKKSEEKKKEKRQKTFLDKAYPKYSYEFISSVVQACRASLVLLVGISFWMMFRGSNGLLAFQMMQSNFQVGSVVLHYYIVNAMNVITVTVSILLCNIALFPLMEWISKKNKVCGIIFSVKPSRKMGAGSILCVIFFVIMLLAVIEQGQHALEPLPKPSRILVWGHSEVRNCSLSFGNENVDVPSSDKYNKLDVSNGTLPFSSNCDITNVVNESVSIKPGVNVFAFFPDGNGSYFFDQRHFVYQRFVHPSVQVALINYQLITCESNASISMDEPKLALPAKAPFNYTLQHFKIAPFTISNGDHWKHKVEVDGQHGAYVLFFDDTKFCSANGTASGKIRQFEIVSPFYTTSMFAGLESCLLALGEVTLGIGAMEFAYSETSPELKTVMQGVWYATAFFGSLIGILISSVIDNKLVEASCYLGVSVVNLVYFVVIIFLYKPKKQDEKKDEKEDKKEKDESDSDVEDTSKGSKGEENKESKKEETSKRKEPKEDPNKKNTKKGEDKSNISEVQ